MSFGTPVSGRLLVDLFSAVSCTHVTYMLPPEPTHLDFRTIRARPLAALFFFFITLDPSVE